MNVNKYVTYVITRCVLLWHVAWIWNTLVACRQRGWSLSVGLGRPSLFCKSINESIKLVRHQNRKCIGGAECMTSRWNQNSRNMLTYLKIRY